MNAGFLDANLNQTVTICGKAKHAKAGAILVLDDNTPVYLQGLEQWENKYLEKKIRVSGILKLDPIYPNTKILDGMHIQGMNDSAYSMENYSILK